MYAIYMHGWDVFVVGCWLWGRCSSFGDLKGGLGVECCGVCVWFVYCLCSFVSISRWDVHIVGFGQCVGRWVWCAYVSSGLEPVGWGCALCVVMMG